MKKIIVSISAIMFMLIFMSTAYASNPIGWYCKRNKNHNQPVLDGELIMAENYDILWRDKNHKSMDDEEKVIYLTFDAGYENGNIEKILDVLKKENVTATFFILENMIKKSPDLVKRMIDEGHVVANHTSKHKDMTKMKSIDEFKGELESLELLYKNTFGVDMPKFYRPPEGKFNEENLKWATDLGYKTVMWSFAYADWDNGRQPSYDLAMKKIMENLHNGEVMLLHPTSSTNAQIMPDLIKELKNKGFRFGTVNELCQN